MYASFIKVELAFASFTTSVCLSQGPENHIFDMESSRQDPYLPVSLEG